jgi:rhodanese-related sulfurtransferase
VVPYVLGALQANEVIKGVLGMQLATDELVLLDLATLEQTRIRRTRRSGCPGCAGELTRSSPGWDVRDLDEACSRFESIEIVDIRESGEEPELWLNHRRVACEACYTSHWPLPTLFVCATGTRSYRLAAVLRAAGNDHVFSLAGGIASLER